MGTVYLSSSESFTLRADCIFLVGFFVCYPSERRAKCQAGWTTELNTSPRISRMTAWKHIGLNVNSCCGPPVKLWSLTVSCSNFFFFFCTKSSQTHGHIWALHVDAVSCHNLTNILNTIMLRPLLLYFVSYSHCFTKKPFFFLFFLQMSVSER